MKKSALLIGGSSGIGLATLKKLAQHDFDIALIHRDRRQQVVELESTIAELNKSSKVFTYNVDATDSNKISETVKELVSNYKKFDLVVHAVSRGNLKPMISVEGRSLEKMDFELTLEAMGTNVHTWANQLVGAKLLGEGSRIVTITSEGNKRYLPNYAAVAAAKSTLETITNYLAIELAPLGITANAIQAGVTDTPSLRLIPNSEKILNESKNRNPFNKLTTPEDVAGAIYLLTLPEAKWINGALIHVDGGEHLI